MEFYFIILFFLSTLGLLSLANKEKNNFSFFACFIICFFFIVLSSIRWDRGTDWSAYYEIYQATNIIGVCLKIYCIGVEPGFYFINWLFSSFYSYSFFLFFLACVIIPLKTLFFFKKSEYPFIALLLYFSILVFDIFPVRQSLSSSLCLLFYLIYKNHKKSSFLVALLALMVHYSAIIFFIGLLVCSTKKIHKGKVVIFSIFILVLFFIVVKYPPEILSSRINDYIINQKVYSDDITPLRNLLKCLDQIFIMFLCWRLMLVGCVDKIILRLSIFGSFLFISATLLAPQLA
ncbi:hypothetical protein FOE31_26225, partial [Salmonella enterica]|nr:hypothetical protein [Salmonella enterica]